MIRQELVLIIAISLFACGHSNQDETHVDHSPQINIESDNGLEVAPVEIPIDTLEKTSTFHVETFQNNEQDWGYRIMQDDQVFINQPHIPAIPGKYGFRNEEEAERIGLLVVHKLDAGAMPPSVTRDELDSLAIEYPSSN